MQMKPRERCTPSRETGGINGGDSRGAVFGKWGENKVGNDVWRASEARSKVSTEVPEKQPNKSADGEVRLSPAGGESSVSRPQQPLDIFNLRLTLDSCLRGFAPIQPHEPQ
ncbi:unnamed protein product [Pleuronectes platessa]|uniref:Uncharacterized protein n=1 Tax=Pleuronectes platessa TaxID=8262 RepID=A0A9N7V3W0_PLEPL|nr:unnamed protein product [Pleuronectes platessa]